MKRFWTGLVAATLMFACVPSVNAQLITVHKTYTIKAVDTIHDRLAVKYLNAANEPVKEQLLVDVNGATHVFIHGHPVAWTALRPGMEIDVHGGLEDSMHIRAKSIDVLRIHA